MRAAAVEVLAVAGAVFVLLAGVGALRFPDVYARMHAATKASTLGIALVGLATAVALDDGRAKTLVAVAFIFVTAPTGAHFVGRAAYRAEGIAIDLATRDDLAALIDGPDPPGTSPGERRAQGGDAPSSGDPPGDSRRRERGRRPTTGEPPGAGRPGP